MGLKINFSDQEAQSEARTFEPIPSGEYYCRITDVEDKESTSEKNHGKPYWHIELTVQDGEHADRKLWSNVMLFEGALYSLAQLLKATGQEKALQSGDIPDGHTFVGKEVVVVVKKQRDSYAEERDGDGVPQWKNEVKGFKKYEGQKSSKAAVKGGKAASLLP